MSQFIDKILLVARLYFYKVLSKILFSKPQEKQTKSILFLSCFFPGNSGYNWRANEWALALRKEGFKVDVQHAIEKDEFYKYKDSNLSKFLSVFLKRRFWQVVNSKKYDKVIVRRELLLFNDYGNLFLDKFLLKIHPNAILDFDDDIAFAKNEPRKISSLYAKLLQEDGSKFTNSIKLYKKFIVGSQYLRNYVLERNLKINESDIEVIPTCVNYETYKPKKYDLNKKRITFGWIGGNHNLFLLDTVIVALNEVSQKYEIELLVIAGKEYCPKNAKFRIRNKVWSLESEKENLKTIDIGLMPLKNTPRDEGKCSFKLIQYMGMGVVSAATKVGMNIEVINEANKEGFLVDNDWGKKIMEAIENKSSWSEIGENARNKVLKNYTYTANLPKLVNYLTQNS